MVSLSSCITSHDFFQQKFKFECICFSKHNNKMEKMVSQGRAWRINLPAISSSSIDEYFVQQLFSNTHMASSGAEWWKYSNDHIKCFAYVLPSTSSFWDCGNLCCGDSNYDSMLLIVSHGKNFKDIFC